MLALPDQSLEFAGWPRLDEVQAEFDDLKTYGSTVALEDLNA